MIRLEQLSKGMIVKGIVADDTVKILDLQWRMPDLIVVTYQDSEKRTGKTILNPSHETKLDVISESTLPLELLPQRPGEEGMRALTKTQKKVLNKSLSKAGFKFRWDKEAGYSDWAKGEITYRVYHTTPHESFIILIEKTTPESTPESPSVDKQGETEQNSTHQSPVPAPENSYHTMTSSASPSSAGQQQFVPGMYVRIPFDVEELDGEYRDYRIGQIESHNTVANTVTVKLQTHSPGQAVVREIVERDAAHIHRCHILPETAFTHVDTEQTGQVLLPCQEEWEKGQLCDYYVQIAGQIRRLPEDKLLVASHRQSPVPSYQLQKYELHHPRWKFQRDQLIESYAQLHTATFGLEDLVGSRIMLLPHQAEVVATVLGDESCRYILADEVGLGKTIEACVILKGLYRRHPGLKTLIITPASLIQQWHYELNSKFWLNFTFGDQLERLSLPENSPGVIISTEKLLSDGDLSLWLSMQSWGLLIVDEAHHIHKRPLLYERIYQFSSDAERTLILSATPIQRRASEFLSLLKLMNPARYDALNKVQFSHILQAQQTLRGTIAYLAQALNPDDFDIEEFAEEMETVIDELEDDKMLTQLVQKASVQTNLASQLTAAKEAISYVSENYRIESRVIRNRRVNLNIELPQRAIDTSYSYPPDGLEVELLDELHDYIDDMLGKTSNEDQIALILEYSRILLHRAFSSPHSLGTLLKQRQQLIYPTHQCQGSQLTHDQVTDLITPAAPRLEFNRIHRLLQYISPISEESEKLNRLLWLNESWQEQTDKTLESLSMGMTIPDLPHRLVQVLRAIQNQLQAHPASKIVVFSAWTETLLALQPHLAKHLNPIRGHIAQFHCQVPSHLLQEEVDKFQSQENYHVLLCDELGGEGRNFQVADSIIHIDLTWTPAQLEQRIGRVDRLGRTGTVLSILPYAQNRIEHDLFRIWEEGFNLFTHSMSGLEIALENVLDELLTALGSGSRDSLIDLLPKITTKAKELRAMVEEERYFEENAINHRRRDEFKQVSEKYRDGTELRISFTRWATMAGLENTYKRETDTVRFYPQRFNPRSMANAKFVTPPNMEEALSRSGRTRNLVITGTFNRDIAVQREDLVFFAPGNDPWTDAIINNAFEADRGRSCAILRTTDKLAKPWQGFELFYQLQVDPRPLYEAQFPPIHLLRAQGYLYVSTYRLLVSSDGDIISRSHPAWQAIRAYPFSKTRGDIHLGKRGGQRQLGRFKEAFPPDVWEDMVEQVLAAAAQNIAEEFDFTQDVAREAMEDFERKALGLQAAHHWFQHVYGKTTPMVNIDEYKQISNALVEGIRHPLWRLESACFWILHPANNHE